MNQQIITIESLTFSIGGYFTSEAYELDLRDGQLKVAVLEQPGRELSRIDQFVLTPEQVDKLIKNINQNKILRWKSKYINSDMCDGIQWELSIKFNRGKKKSIYGSNEYPREFSKAIKSLFEDYADARFIHFLNDLEDDS